MQNVQQLLDELGSPPPEVCLDWAWQLVHLSEQPNCPQSLGWSDLRISSQGSLAFAYPKIQDHPETTSTTNDTQELILCLLMWAGLDESKLSSIDTLHACHSALQSLTSHCVNRQTRSKATLDSLSVEARETISTDPLNSTANAGTAQQEPAASLDLAEGSLQQLQPIAFETISTQQSSSQRPSKQTAKANSHRLNNRRLLVAGGIGAVVLAITTAYFAMSRGNTKSDTLASKDSTTASEAIGSKKPSDSTPKSPKKSARSTKSSGSELDELLSGSGSTISDNSTSSNEQPEITTTLEVTTLDGERTSELGLSQPDETSSAAESLGSITSNNRPQRDESNLSSSEASQTSSEQAASVLYRKQN